MAYVRFKNCGLLVYELFSQRRSSVPYWGSEPDQSDYASITLGAYISLVKERMIEGISTVIKKSHSEQGMIVSLICLRLMGQHYPKDLSVHFGQKDFAFVKSAFAEWYEKVKSKIPAKHREGILAEAQKEFALFEEMLLKKKEEEA